MVRHADRVLGTCRHEILTAEEEVQHVKIPGLASLAHSSFLNPTLKF